MESGARGKPKCQDSRVEGEANYTTRYGRGERAKQGFLRHQVAKEGKKY